MLVLSLFDYSTNFVRPWADAGFLCYCIDTQHPPGENRAGNIIRVGVDILEFLPPQGEYAFCAAFPPCTHLAVSGARWFKGKGLGKLAESIRLFQRAAAMAEWTGAPYLIENPVSTISTYWRHPNFAFDPCDYGDPWTKKTCLWTGGGFVMPKKERIAPILGSLAHRMPPSPDRANRRSETPVGFARAVFEANRDIRVPVLGHHPATAVTRTGNRVNQPANRRLPPKSKPDNDVGNAGGEWGGLKAA